MKLQILSLANNSLSGQIPTGSQLQSQNVSAYRPGNEDLCGPPLPACSFKSEYGHSFTDPGSWFRSGLPHGRIYILLLEAWSELRNDVTNARRWHPPRRRSPLLSGIDAQILGFPDPPKSKSPCQIFDFHIVLKQQLVTNSRILDEHDIGCHCIIKNFVKLLEFFLLSSNIFLYRNHPVEVLPILRWWYSPECLRLRYTNTLTRLLHKRIIAWGITDQEMKKFHKVDSKVLHQ